MKPKPPLAEAAAFLLLVPFCSHLLAAEKTHLECKILEESGKIIRCSYLTPRSSHERRVTFHWHNAAMPHDDRERTLLLPAGHGSIYDFRYYYGRAPGDWSVLVKDEEENTLAEGSFSVK